jgi:adenine-specific DNA-methyltransferase
MDFDNSESVFDTPKPPRLVARMLQLATTTSASEIVMDFFAGSGTTGHAVFDLNQFDSGNRRFILVQLPEPTGQSSFPLISDITKERLRQCGKRIREAETAAGTETQGPDLFSSVDPTPLVLERSSDLGFRVFKLDSSNIRAWDPNRGDVSQSLLDSVEHLRLDRTEQDILFELLLKLGLELTVRIEQKSIAGKAVHSIGVGSLMVCLSAMIARDEVEPLAHGIVAWNKELAPAGGTQIVFRDSAFDDDVAKTNITAILQQHGLENVRSL